MVDKVITPKAAAALVNSGDVVTTSGFVGIGVPDELLLALEQRFLDDGAPRDLTLLFAAGQGDGRDRGLNRLGHEGLLKRVIGGHWGLIPKVARLAVENRIEAYNLPQGVISHLFRDIAAGKPGTLTHVGLGTFVDPELEGGQINATTTEALVERIRIAGRELLFYHGMPIDVAFLRGTTADSLGNVTLEREALTIDSLSQAMAVRNSGGVVIVQVERLAEDNSLEPRKVVLPSALVDAVVVARPENHVQTYATDYSPQFAGQLRAPAGAVETMPQDARKIIARRCAFELPIGGVVNLGIGMPEGVAAVAGEENLLRHVTLTAEPGVIGGQPASGLDFGAAVNTDAIIPQNTQFDFYDGGGLDLAVLGMAEADAAGNVNVSRFGPRLAGAGGFINISQNAHKVVFAGTFTAGGLQIALEDGKLAILQEGKARKFRGDVGQITFSGRQASDGRRTVFYVTERCVFELRKGALTLTEIAPGIDLERDILAHMDFCPEIGELVQMDERIFAPDPMKLREDLLHLDMPQRIVLEADNRLFINLGKLRIKWPADVQAIRGRVTELCEGLLQQVDTIVSYDGTVIDEDIESEYADMVRALEEKYYRSVTRYSSSAFMRMKLGEKLFRDAKPHIFQNQDQAKKHLKTGG
ncbi:acyl CoA:acetate/3-ketoacid CoA transferase [uncultured Ruegeria sp.]|uniref:acyl CoA:acetate/3-ketoacid CoA transferase n=1 Tax=uncultured Ruegeria sp. TaxID=259304 RepID=UPI002638B4B0|nr:CoA-transferase [uncultured Ruegeria sp.]